MTKISKSACWVASLLYVCLLFGCTAKHYVKSADKEAYKIIEQKQENIDGMRPEFTIDRDEDSLYKDASTTLPQLFSLTDAITIAVKNSRAYQSEKERLYSSALSLSLARHEFDPIFSGSASGDATRTGEITDASGVLSFGISKMLSTGADISLNIATNLSRIISSHDPAEAASSLFSASITQPLLRGGFRKIALEDLTQAERDMVYAIRGFVRYRKTFSVGIAKEYYRVLQKKDQLENDWKNYQDLKKDYERAEFFVKAGLKAKFEVDQTKQDELQSRDNWISSKESHEKALDNFKITLGLPIDMILELDQGEMKNLADRGIIPLEISLDDAIEVALEERLDLKTTKNEVEDKERKVAVAKNNLKPDLDLKLFYSANTEEQAKPLKFTSDTDSHGAEISFTFPFDKKSERNSYRRALISLDAAHRSLSKAIDEAKLDVRDALRNLEQAEKSYEIQKMSLALGERRVEMTQLFFDQGTAKTRDVLDAREDLLDAQNSVTSALVNHYNARLDLLLAMETLTIDYNGLFQKEEEQIEKGK